MVHCTNAVRGGHRADIQQPYPLPQRIANGPGKCHVLMKLAFMSDLAQGLLMPFDVVNGDHVITTMAARTAATFNTQGAVHIQGAVQNK